MRNVADTDKNTAVCNGYTRNVTSGCAADTNTAVCNGYVRNVAIRLAYDGTAYHGWQRQKNASTVQETVERAVRAVTGETVNVTGCGRTDAGVHALTYVANFRTKSSIPADRLPFALNSHLPQDISVLSSADVPDEFHATFSAVEKEYTYKIYHQAIHNPFYVNRMYHLVKPPDVESMQAAAALLIGKHDFAAFRAVGSNVKTSVRTMYAAEVNAEGDTIEIRLCANGFLYNMARSIAGTLLYVSQKKLVPNDILRLFESRNRSDAGPTLPPYGLYMTGVTYNICI